TDSILFAETNPLTGEMKQWTGVKVDNHKYDLTKKYTRPDYRINTLYANIQLKWHYASEANVISTPAVSNGLVVFGNQQGKFTALSLSDGKIKWSYQTQGAIYSSPAIAKDKI